jgi:hypothetical protein
MLVLLVNNFVTFPAFLCYLFNLPVLTHVQLPVQGVLVDDSSAVMDDSNAVEEKAGEIMPLKQKRF